MMYSFGLFLLREEAVSIEQHCRALRDEGKPPGMSSQAEPSRDQVRGCVPVPAGSGMLDAGGRVQDAGCGHRWMDSP